MFRDGHGCAITTAQGTWASQGQRKSPATLSHPPQHAEQALTTTTTSELMESRGSLACRGCQRVETGPRCPPASRRRPSPRVVSFAPSGGLVLSSDSAHPKHLRRLVRQRPRCNARGGSPGHPWAARAFVARSMPSDILYRLPQQPQEARGASDDVRPPTAALLQHTQRASRRPRAAALFGNLMTVISIAFIVGTRPLPTDP